MNNEKLLQYYTFFDSIYGEFNSKVNWSLRKNSGRIFINDHCHLTASNNWEVLFLFYINNYYFDEYDDLIKYEYNGFLLFKILDEWSKQSDIFLFYNNL